MADFEQIVAQAKKMYKPLFWPFYVPKPEDAYRWRVALACGCIFEEFSSGIERFPDSGRYLDPLGRGVLNLGERVCRDPEHRSRVTRPYREIVSWLDHEVIEYPDDPEECPYEGMKPSTWAVIRKSARSTAHWDVELSCGHLGSAVSLDPEWRPEDSPRLTTIKRAREMTEEMDAYWAQNPDADPQALVEREHERRMLAMRWPHPRPEVDCYACSVVARITGYQRIGWLVPRTKPKPQPTPKSQKDKVLARLAALESEAEELRRQLREFD